MTRTSVPLLAYVPPSEPLPEQAHKGFQALCQEPLNNHLHVQDRPTHITTLTRKWPFRRFPIRFRNQFYVLFSDLERCYEMDNLSDYFQEPVRICSRLQEFKDSAQTLWQREPELVRKDAALWNNGVVTDRTIRRSLRHLAPSAAYFRPTVARSVYQLFRAQNVLDPCAGWGDRLLGALSLPHVRYTGVDPNQALQPGYQRMVQEFRHDSCAKDQYCVIPAPIQKAEQFVAQRGPYDLVFTSPPYFDREVYDEQDTHQSINGIHTLREWEETFLYPCLRICWKHLKDEGYLAFNVNDYGKHMVPRHQYMQKMNEFIASLPGAHYEGCLPFHGHRALREQLGKPQRSPQPIWCWKKRRLKAFQRVTPKITQASQRE